MWNYVKTVKPKFVLFLLWCIKDAGAAHWKMKDSNFGTYVNNDKSFISKVNQDFSDDFMYKDDIPFFPYSPEDDFEQLGIPLLRDVLYNTRIGTLNKNKVEFDNGVNGILVRFLQEKKKGNLRIRKNLIYIHDKSYTLQFSTRISFLLVRKKMNLLIFYICISSI